MELSDRRNLSTVKANKHISVEVGVYNLVNPTCDDSRLNYFHNHLTMPIYFPGSEVLGGCDQQPGHPLDGNYSNLLIAQLLGLLLGRNGSAWAVLQPIDLSDYRGSPCVDKGRGLAAASRPHPG